MPPVLIAHLNASQLVVTCAVHNSILLEENIAIVPNIQGCNSITYPFDMDGTCIGPGTIIEELDLPRIVGYRHKALAFRSKTICTIDGAADSPGCIAAEGNRPIVAIHFKITIPPKIYRTAISSGFVTDEGYIPRVPVNIRIGVPHVPLILNNSISADSTTVGSGRVAGEINIAGITCYGYILDSANRTASTGGGGIVVELNGTIARQRDRGCGVDGTTFVACRALTERNASVAGKAYVPRDRVNGTTGKT